MRRTWATQIIHRVSYCSCKKNYRPLYPLSQNQMEAPTAMKEFTQIHNKTEAISGNHHSLSYQAESMIDQCTHQLKSSSCLLIILRCLAIEVMSGNATLKADLESPSFVSSPIWLYFSSRTKKWEESYFNIIASILSHNNGLLRESLFLKRSHRPLFALVSQFH